MADVVTFGCRLNAYESEVMRGHALAAGLTDAVIINTCAVTAEAERQARQSIRRLRRERPEARIIVTGCASQIDSESFSAMPEVDHVIANDKKLEVGVFEKLGQSQDGGPKDSLPLAGRVREGGVVTEDQIDLSLHAPSPDPSREGRGKLQRAFVQVQN